MLNDGKTEIRKLCLSRPFQSTYTFITNDNKITRLLYLLYGDYLNETEFEVGDTIHVLEQNNSYTLMINNAIITTQDPLVYISNYIYENTIFASNVIALHGAAVEHNGTAHLFIGKTQSGKTTLTSYLVSNNFGYITEDCILIDMYSLNVIPYHTPIHLREGGLNILKQLKVPVEKMDLLRISDSDIRYVFSPDYETERMVPISNVYFINRNASSYSLSIMNESDKIISLLTSLFSPRPIDKNILRAISRLTSFRFSQLSYKDVSEVIPLITDEKNY